MPFFKTIFLFLPLFLALYGWGQQAEQYTFTHYKTTGGLASNTVNNMAQDADGFIWLSTNNGLQRFDGHTFKTYKSGGGSPYNLPSDEITQVFYDGKKNLWVTTSDNKVGVFDTRLFRYREVPVSQWKREKIQVDKTFWEASDGRLLLHFRKSDKLYEYREDQQSFVPSQYIHFPPQWKVNNLFKDADGRRFWIASDSGLAVYNTASRKLSYAGANAENESFVSRYGAQKYLNHIYIDAAKRIFIEQWPKASKHPLLTVFDSRTGKERKFDFHSDFGLGYHQIKAIKQQRNGKVWIYGLPFLAEFTGGQNPVQFLKKDYNKEKELKFNQVYSMYEDRQRNMWVCTDYGIYLFNPDAQLFHNYALTTPKRFAVEGRAQTAMQTPGKEIWVGYRDLGVFRYDSLLHPLPLPESLVPLQENKSVWDLHLHSKTGKIWIALQGGSLIVYDTATRKATALSPPVFEQRAITQITEDALGNLWFGTQAGNLVKWDIKAGAAKTEDGFTLVKKTGIIEKLFTDSRGFVWVGAYGDGLLKIDPRTAKVVHQVWENNKAGFNLWNNNPKDIIQYNDSLLIVASGALNLVNLNTHQVRHISNQEGLPTNTVQSLVNDPAGRLWLGTMNGLYMADIAKLSFTTYNESDGLLNDHFNVGGAHAMKDGRLLFTSQESFVLFDPSEAKSKEVPGIAYLTDVRLMNSSLSVDSLLRLKVLSLDYDNTSLVLEFSALNFSKLNKLEYLYQLEGFDTAWIRAGDSHQAVYTFLHPGKYVFRIKVRNAEGVFGPVTEYLTIRVSPPFWRAGWFYAFLFICVLLVLYIIDRERIKRLASLYNVRSDIAGQLHEDVSITLNNINVLSQIARKKADKDLVRSKELIDEISGKSYNMMVSMDEILWSIDPNNDTMEKTLLRIAEYARMREAKFGAPIDISVHDKVKDLRLSMKLRHQFFMACKTILQSLASYPGESMIVDIDCVRSRIVLKILHVGTEAEEAYQARLTLRKAIEEKAGIMQATMGFEVGKKDTSIILSIPVK